MTKKIKDKLQERAKYARGRFVVDRETGEVIEDFVPTPRTRLPHQVAAPTPAPTPAPATGSSSSS